MPGGKEVILGISVLVCVLVGLRLCDFRGRLPSEPKNLPLELHEGSLGVLPCKIKGTPKEVTWLKVHRFWPDTTLVTYDVNSGKRRGAGYEEGLFNIREDYYLEINSVKAEDKGDYVCLMKSMANEIVSRDRTVTVKVFGMTESDAYTSRDVMYSVTIMLGTLLAIGVIGVISLIALPKSKHSVPENEKQPLSREEVEKYACDVMIRHCHKISDIITAHGGRKDVLTNQKPYGNEEVLFQTCKMINEWFDGQECSNYEKRQKIQAALRIAKSSVPDDELFTAK